MQNISIGLQDKHKVPVVCDNNCKDNTLVTGFSVLWSVDISDDEAMWCIKCLLVTDGVKVCLVNELQLWH